MSIYSLDISGEAMLLTNENYISTKDFQTIVTNIKYNLPKSMFWTTEQIKVDDKLINLLKAELSTLGFKIIQPICADMW